MMINKPSRFLTASRAHFLTSHMLLTNVLVFCRVERFRPDGSQGLHCWHEKKNRLIATPAKFKLNFRLVSEYKQIGMCCSCKYILCREEIKMRVLFYFGPALMKWSWMLWHYCVQYYNIVPFKFLHVAESAAPSQVWRQRKGFRCPHLLANMQSTNQNPDLSCIRSET